MEEWRGGARVIVSNPLSRPTGGMKASVEVEIRLAWITETEIFICHHCWHSFPSFACTNSKRRRFSWKKMYNRFEMLLHDSLKLLFGMDNDSRLRYRGGHASCCGLVSLRLNPADIGFGIGLTSPSCAFPVPLSHNLEKKDWSAAGNKWTWNKLKICFPEWNCFVFPFFSSRWFLFLIF